MTIEHVRRDYEAFLRGPVGINTFAFGTVDAYRGGVQHDPQLAGIPAPTDNPLNDFGLQGGGGFEVVISDEVEGDGVLDWYWLWPDGSRITLEDGSGSLITEY